MTQKLPLTTALSFLRTKALLSTTTLLALPPYRDVVPRCSPHIVCRQLLSGNVSLGCFPLLPITGFAGSLPIRSVVYLFGEELQPCTLDALGALHARDRLVRLCHQQQHKGKGTARTEKALAFCNAALEVLRQDDQAATKHVEKKIYTKPKKLRCFRNDKKPDHALFVLTA